MAADGAGTGAPNLLQLSPRARAPARDLDQGGVGEDALHWPVALLGRALAPANELARDRARRRAQRAHARQAREDRLRVSLVGRTRDHSTLLARPLQAAERRQAALELSGELEQVHHVLASICALLRCQRARIPAGEARALRHAHAEQLTEQRLI